MKKSRIKIFNNDDEEKKGGEINNEEKYKRKEGNINKEEEKEREINKEEKSEKYKRKEEKEKNEDERENVKERKSVKKRDSESTKVRENEREKEKNVKERKSTKGCENTKESDSEDEDGDSDVSYNSSDEEAIKLFNRKICVKNIANIGPIDNSWSIEQIVQYHTPKGWESVFEDASSDLINISRIISEKEKHVERIVPDKKDIFKAFNLIQPKDIKCVIFGMDPYQNLYSDNKPVATGLAFSIEKGRKMQPSISNIFKELYSSIESFIIPSHGDLSAWCKQGVLLLNISLTTDVGVSGAHSKYHVWTPFMIKVFAEIGRINPNCVYLLLGKDAQKIKSELKGNPICIETSHPSGFSANRGFLGSGVFVEVNNKIMNPPEVPKNKKKLVEEKPPPTPINWSIPEI